MSVPADFKLKYEEPFWSGVCKEANWSLDVTRAGVELPSVSLNEKACYLVGRIPVCDVILENETVSRQHAVFQSRANGKLYMMDLGSTYGTFVNKKRLDPNIFFELKPGMQVKFGNSARMYMLCGGMAEDEEEKEDEEEEKKKQPESEDAKPAPKKRNNKKKKDDISSFIGSMEDGEKLIKRKEHEQRRKEFLKKKAKQKETQKKRRDGTLDFMDEEDEDEGEIVEQNEDESSNEGEADPDKLVVGTARDNWEEFEEDVENDDFYDRTKKNTNSTNSAPKRKALSKDEIVNMRIELDLQIKNLETKIEKEKKLLASSKNEEDDELDAYMNVVAQSSKEELIKKMTKRKEELQREDRRMERLLAIASNTFDRMDQASEKKQTLQDRVKSAIDHGFVMPQPTKKRVEREQEEEKEEKPQPEQPKAIAKKGSVVPSNEGTAAIIQEYQKREKKRKVMPEQQKKPAVPISRDPDEDLEVEFVPPKDQTGDGKTSLNDKYGY